ncbi:MetQ/NlpA family ABC transporter substrate-binding protein [Enterococcus sp. LJL98]
MRKSKGWKFFLVGVLFFSAGCGLIEKSDSGEIEDKKELTVGFIAGTPYRDQFEQGIAPTLEKQGYALDYKEFTEGIQLNIALNSGDVDANVFQHELYMESINERESFNNIALIQNPTPPLGLYSNKHDSTDPVKGARINVSNEAVNLIRGLQLLADLGWITIRENINPATTSLSDIVENPYELTFVESDPAYAPLILEDVDFSIIQGANAIESGLSLTSALALEKVAPRFTIIVAVASRNQSSPFVEDLVAAYKNPVFQDYIDGQSQYDGYARPDYFVTRNE